MPIVQQFWREWVTNMHTSSHPYFSINHISLPDLAFKHLRYYDFPAGIRLISHLYQQDAVKVKRSEHLLGVIKKFSAVVCIGL